MDKIVKAMMNLISFEVFGGAICLELFSDFTNDDYIALYKLSKKHDLAHLVGDALIKNNLVIDEKIKSAFQKEVFTAVYRAENMTHEIAEISAILEKEKIEFIPLKGAVIRNYYPEAWMRTSCDIDILVHEKDTKRAVKLLTTKYGYTCPIKTFHDFSLYSKTNVHIELHFILNFYERRDEEFLKKVWKNAKTADGFEYQKKMTESFFLVHTVSHMAQHVLGGGCGIKPFIDLYILKYRANISFEEAMPELEFFHLDSFCKNMLKIAECWLNDKGIDEKLAPFETYIIEGGVYGSLENSVSVGTVRRGGKVKYIFSRLFLPYRELSLLYPSLKKCPVLLPIYEVRRWFRLLNKHGKSPKEIKNELKNVTAVSKEDSEKAKSMLASIGLEKE